MITIAVQCHNYQRRLCWMLSSLAEQTRRSLFEVNVACIPGNGRPKTEAILDFFSASVCLIPSLWPDETQFQKRGLVRNRQLLECRTEWLLFADCDLVYHPRYFARLAKVLLAHHAEAPYMLSAGRQSTDLEQATQTVNASIPDMPIQVKEAFTQARQIPGANYRRNIGAGFSQLINVRHAPHGGLYVDPETNRDWDWHQRCFCSNSDVQFRQRICAKAGPRRRLSRWFGENLIHLNHARDTRTQPHLTLQR